MSGVTHGDLDTRDSIAIRFMGGSTIQTRCWIHAYARSHVHPWRRAYATRKKGVGMGSGWEKEYPSDVRQWHPLRRRQWLSKNILGRSYVTLPSVLYRVYANVDDLRLNLCWRAALSRLLPMLSFRHLLLDWPFHICYPEHSNANSWMVYVRYRHDTHSDEFWKDEILPPLQLTWRPRCAMWALDGQVLGFNPGRNNSGNDLFLNWF